MDRVDLRSATVTHPTEEMYRQVEAAPLGDDVFGDDPTVNRLEQVSADRLGKEAAVFVPTGTMANTIAINGSHFTTQRMVREYVAGMYFV